MNSRFLPKCIDNQYRGHKLALWFFWIVIIIRGLQGLSLILGGASIVREADGVPLETFPAAASQSIVAVFVVSGLSRLVLSLLGVLIFVRYRSAIPLMFAVLALDQLKVTPSLCLSSFSCWEPHRSDRQPWSIGTDFFWPYTLNHG